MTDRKSSFQRAALAATLVFMVLSTLVVAAWSTVWPTDPGVAYGRATTPDAAPEGTATFADVDARAVADNLFNHVVEAASANDSAQLEAYLPLALTAYAELGATDADALFHLATLQRVGDLPEHSLRTALQILEAEPAHLLGLGAAAVAAQAAGDAGQASALYGRFVAAYDAEIARELPEYVGHASFLQRVRRDASGAADRP